MSRLYALPGGFALLLVALSIWLPFDDPPVPEPFVPGQPTIIPFPTTGRATRVPTPTPPPPIYLPLVGR